MNFIADCHLGKIAKYLRIFGFNTLYFQSIDDNDIIDISKNKNRIILTSDRELYNRVSANNALYIYHGKFEDQLRTIFEHFDLYTKIKPFTICTECNGEIEMIHKSEAVNHIPAKTKLYHNDFYKCKKCGKIYWQGDHFKRMQNFVDNFIKEDKMKNINIKVANITQESVCAIVNAANSSLLGGGGVDGAIHLAGGVEILNECKKLRQTKYKDGLPTGEAVATTAGDMKAKFVIHTVGPIYSLCAPHCEELLTNCYLNSLKCAKKLGCKSISFPAISTGIYGYPKDKAAKIAYRCVESFLSKNNGMEVNFVFSTSKNKDIFLNYI